MGSLITFVSLLVITWGIACVICCSSLCTTGWYTTWFIVFVTLFVEGWTIVWVVLTTSLWTEGTYSFW